jgi:hypothetical protein
MARQARRHAATGSVRKSAVLLWVAMVDACEVDFILRRETCRLLDLEQGRAPVLP